MRHNLSGADRLTCIRRVLLSSGPAARSSVLSRCQARTSQPVSRPILISQSSSAVITSVERASAGSQQSTEPVQAATEPSDSDLVEIGIFLSPHGLKGEVRLQPLTDFPEQRLRSKATRWVQAQSKGRIPAAKSQITLAGGRPSIYKGHEIWLVRVAGVTTPEAASLLRNHRLLMPMTEVSMTDEDEFYPWELVGMQVHHQEAHASMGVVTDVYDSTGAHDVLRVQLASGEGSVLIPFVKEFVPTVDRLGGKLHIDPPAGLLDLVTPVQQPQTKRSGLRSRSFDAKSRTA